MEKMKKFRIDLPVSYQVPLKTVRNRLAKATGQSFTYSTVVWMILARQLGVPKLFEDAMAELVAINEAKYAEKMKDKPKPKAKSKRKRKPRRRKILPNYAKAIIEGEVDVTAPGRTKPPRRARKARPVTNNRDTFMQDVPK